MKSLTNLTSLLALMGSLLLLGGCVSGTELSNQDPGVDPYPWCADQRREAAEHMPKATDSSSETLEKRDRYIDAHVDKACQHP